MSLDDQDTSHFDIAAQEVVELGNRLQEADTEQDTWEIASGMLAGVIQYWLYSRQPCGDPYCDSCNEVNTAEQRLQKLLEETRQFAEESEYFHSPNDSNVGTA